MAVKPPKLNPEIESCHQFQNNTSFAMSNAKSLYSSQNFVVKTIKIMSDIANSVSLASDNGHSGGPINHVNIVKAGMNEVTLLGHVSAEFERKRFNKSEQLIKYRPQRFCSIMWTKTRLSCIQNQTKKYTIKIPPWWQP